MCDIGRERVQGKCPQQGQNMDTIKLSLYKCNYNQGPGFDEFSMATTFVAIYNAPAQINKKAFAWQI